MSPCCPRQARDAWRAARYSRRIFQNDGKGWRQGDIFRQPQLARTLERIEASPDDFYTGAMAREIAEFVEKGGGIITTEDLASYEVRDRTPLHGVYRGLEIISAPPRRLQQPPITWCCSWAAPMLAPATSKIKRRYERGRVRALSPTQSRAAAGSGGADLLDLV